MSLISASCTQSLKPCNRRVNAYAPDIVFVPVQRRGHSAGVVRDAAGGLGGGKPIGSLTEQIADLKAKKFDHGTTRFPLTGKHLKNDCADCHKTMLEKTPRECVACHKADDTHNGRRPDCGQCHTPERWTKIIKR